MTIDEQVEYLGKRLVHLRGKAGKSYEREFDAYQNDLRLVLLEVARDQRRACAEAIAEVAAGAADEIQTVRNTEGEPMPYENLTRAERRLRNLSNVVVNAEIK
jgi:hypothetical protein